MTRSRALFFAVSSLLILFIVGGSLLGAAGNDEGDGSLYKYLSVFTEALSLVQQAYVDEVDLDTLMAGALDSTTEALDPFSLYLPAGEVERYLHAREVGVRLCGLLLLKERGIAFVASVEPGSPADEAGIQVSDIVTEIDGESTRVMPVWEIQEILGGEPGSKVKLSLMHQGDRQDVELALGTYEAPSASLDTVDGARVLRVGALRPANLATIRADLEGAASEGVGGLVVDLRGVAGGDPETAYRVAGFFTQGELGILNRRGQALATFTSDEEPLWRGKLVVLISRGTLGAAEVLARVLHEKADAELVGERSFGYTGRQDIAELPSGGRLIYTDAFYTGPDREVPDAGLEPDVRVNYSTRTFDERDLPIRELILRRGIHRLLEEDHEEEPQREAA
jgi:carboxyl-terminal processing protease